MENNTENIKNYPQEYFKELEKGIVGLDFAKIQKVIEVVFEAYRNNRQVFILGNGGSASTASHFACDLGKGTLQNVYDMKEKRFKVISLTDNVATLMAYGNDLSFDDVFVQQLNNLINEGDVVIGISGSGNSANVIKAIEYAKQCGAKTIGLLGFKTGGKMGGVVDYEITVADNHYGRIEDIHLALCHMISDSLAILKKQKENHLA